MGRLLLAGVAVVLVALTAAAPATGAERETAPPPGFTDLQFGRLLMEAGRLEDARVFLERARAAGEEEIERRFLLGRVEMRLGRPRRAARHFEAILAVRPELTRVRLELASAYYAAGRDEKARGHFEGALADRPPASVEAAVRGFLDRIDTRRRWTRSFSLALAPESNPLKRTDRDEVRIGGVPFRPDQTARSGTGLAVSAGLSFTPIIADDLRAVAAVSVAAKLYRRSAWNDVSGEGELGLARRFDQADLSGGLRLGRRWLGGEAYSHGIGPWLRGRLALSAATSLGLHADLEALDYEDGPARDGSRLGLRPGLRHALSMPDRAGDRARFRDRQRTAGTARQPDARTRPGGVARLRRRSVRRDGPVVAAAPVRRPGPALRRHPGRHHPPALGEAPAPRLAGTRIRAVSRIHLREERLPAADPHLPQPCGDAWSLTVVLRRIGTLALEYYRVRRALRCGRDDSSVQGAETDPLDFRMEPRRRFLVRCFVQSAGEIAESRPSRGDRSRLREIHGVSNRTDGKYVENLAVSAVANGQPMSSA